MSKNKTNVGLFVSCLVDTVEPQIGFAAIDLLEKAGCAVEVPLQSCCGQPAYNSGDAQSAAAIAKQWINCFEPYQYIVVPSGSCAGMVVEHYTGLFTGLGEAKWAQRAAKCAQKTYELSQFLVQVLGCTVRGHMKPTTASYHDSCAGLRELGIQQSPRALLQNISGLELIENPLAQNCCGFGGAFCVKHPSISVKLADDKLQAVSDCGAQLLIGGDLGCLMHLKGRAQNQQQSLQIKHFAQVLVAADITLRRA